MLDWFLSSGSFKGNYNFHIEVSPKVVESNSNLTITCYSNKNKGAVIPVAITWFKIKNGLSTHMASVRGNTYLCDPSDVGAVIRAEVKVPVRRNSESRGRIGWNCSCRCRPSQNRYHHKEEHRVYIILRCGQLHCLHGW